MRKDVREKPKSIFGTVVYCYNQHDCLFMRDFEFVVNVHLKFDMQLLPSVPNDMVNTIIIIPSSFRKRKAILVDHKRLQTASVKHRLQTCAKIAISKLKLLNQIAIILKLIQLLCCSYIEYLHGSWSAHYFKPKVRRSIPSVVDT